MSDDLSIPNSGFRGSRAGRYGTGRLRQGMDPDTRRLVMFAGGLGVVLISLIGASALVGRHGGEVPVVSADTRPIREKPLNPGGLKVEGAENDVFSGGSDTSDARLAPAPEAPKALRSVAAPSSSAAANQPSTVQAPNLQTSNGQASNGQGSTVQAPAFEAPGGQASGGQASGSQAGGGQVSGAVTGTSPKVPEARPAGVANAPTVSRPPVSPATASEARPAVAAPAPSASKPAAAKSAAAESHATAGVHQPMVQLAALASEEAARTEWAQLTKKMPDLLSGRQPSYSRTERDGRTFWRLRTAGFADIAQARSFCDRVRAKGTGCSVADF